MSRSGEFQMSVIIAVEAYSPLGRGADLNVAAVTALATKHAVTPAQIEIGRAHV